MFNTYVTKIMFTTILWDCFYNPIVTEIGSRFRGSLAQCHTARKLQPSQLGVRILVSESALSLMLLPGKGKKGERNIKVMCCKLWSCTNILSNFLCLGSLRKAEQSVEWELPLAPLMLSVSASSWTHVIQPFMSLSPFWITNVSITHSNSLLNH